MSHDFNFGDLPDASSIGPDYVEVLINSDVPLHLDVLPDGREAVVIGDPEGDAIFNHLQGNNTFGYQQDCGLVSCEDVLRQFGVDVSEDDVVRHAVIAQQCESCVDVGQSGGSSPIQEASILTDFGVPAHVEQDLSLEELASHVESGQGTIVGVNAGYLWNDANYVGSGNDFGQANHAIVVTGVARDPATGEIEGFYINDSGRGDAGRFVDVSTMQNAWLASGGLCVVTDVVQ